MKISKREFVDLALSLGFTAEVAEAGFSWFPESYEAYLHGMKESHEALSPGQEFVEPDIHDQHFKEFVLMFLRLQEIRFGKSHPKK
jgi:hypothetical protein